MRRKTLAATLTSNRRLRILECAAIRLGVQNADVVKAGDADGLELLV